MANCAEILIALLCTRALYESKSETMIQLNMNNNNYRDAVFYKHIKYYRIVYRSKRHREDCKLKIDHISN